MAHPQCNRRTASVERETIKIAFDCLIIMDENNKKTKIDSKITNGLLYLNRYDTYWGLSPLLWMKWDAPTSKEPINTYNTINTAIFLVLDIPFKTSLLLPRSRPIK